MLSFRLAGTALSYIYLDFVPHCEETNPVSAMEPASILTCIELSGSAVKICWKVGKALKCLFRGINGHNDPVVLLHGEFKALRRNLKTIETVFVKAEQISNHSLESDPILTDVEQSLAECDRHVQRFAEYLAKYVDPDNANVLTVTRIQAAVLKLREQDLRSKREQVRNFRMDVQMIISMVTM